MIASMEENTPRQCFNEGDTRSGDQTSPVEFCNNLEVMHICSESHYAYLLSYGSLIQTPYEIFSDDLWETIFFFPDYCEKNRHLKASSYVFIQRRPIKFQSTWQWTYSCQCDSDHGRFVDSLRDSYVLPYNQVVDWTLCKHIKCIQKLLQTIDTDFEISPEAVSKKWKQSQTEHNYIQNTNEVKLSHVNDYEDRLAILPDNGQRWGICGIQLTHSDEPEARIRCLTCCSYDCHHTRALVFQLPLAPDDDNPVAIFRQAMESPSNKSGNTTEKVYRDQKVPFFPQNKGIIPDFVMASDDGFCICGQKWSTSQEPQEHLLQSTCLVYCDDSVKIMKVYQRSCTSTCDQVKKFDGLTDNMIYCGNHAFSNGVLYDYLRHFLTEGLTMHHYFKTYVQKMLMLGFKDDLGKLHYGKFRKAFLRFIRCIQFNFNEGFQCLECGSQPPVVVLDGICLGLQKTYLKGVSRPENLNSLLKGSSFETRIFIKVKRGRTLLKEFCTTEGSEARFGELLNLMTLYQPSLVPLLNDLMENGHQKQCPEELREFLSSLSEDSPVCALVPPDDDILDLLESIADGYDPRQNPGTHLKLLQIKSPLLFQLLVQHEEIPASVRPVLDELISLSLAPFKGTHHDLSPPITEGSTGYFPCLPILCQRGTYVLDDKTQSSESSLTCKKMTPKKRHRTLTPGLFILNCSHGICYGFEFMMNFESPDMAFTLLRTRFKEAPDIVVYDNGCKLHQYCLNRDPDFFIRTKFVVDRLHWKNHTGCSQAYNMDIYPGMRNLNSQVAEQRNSQIKPLASMLSYTTHENFIYLLKVHMIFRNYLHFAKNFPDRHFQYKDFIINLLPFYCK